MAPGSIRIQQLTADDVSHFADATELLNRTQGRDLFNAQYLPTRTSDPASLVVGAFEGESLVGLGVAQVIVKLDFYLPFDPGIRQRLAGQKIASFSTLCVEERLQGQGIGTLLSRARLQWIEQQACDVVVGVSWVSGLAHTSDRVFEKMGFSAIRRVEAFFAPMSAADPFDCPGCQQQPCSCAAILYMLDLRRSKGA